MKLALDPQMFFSSSSVYELPDIVASIGYDWMELSPKADFVPFFKYPRIDDAGVKRLKKLASDAGVGIASVLPVLRWSGPDEDQRSAAVRAWKRVIQITVDLGVDVINSEFNGRPESPETAEAHFLKSMDELLPISSLLAGLALPMPTFCACICTATEKIPINRESRGCFIQFLLWNKDV